MNIVKITFIVATLALAGFLTVNRADATSTLQVTVHAQASYLCTGGQTFVTATATASGGTGPYTFEWIGDASGIVSSTANPNYGSMNGPVNNTFNMCVRVTSADGQSVLVSDSVYAPCGF